MRYIIREFYYWCINLYYTLANRNLYIGFRAKIAPRSIFYGYNKIEHHSYFSGEMGECSYIGEYSHVVGKIGKYCSIAGKVNFITLTHPVKKYVSTSPCFYSQKKQCGISYVNKNIFDESPKLLGQKESIIVGNDVYIGYGATIIGPVKIGDGAIIAANATVVKDVEPYTVVGGCPAKLIRYRFSKEQIQSLTKIKWWNKNRDWLEKHACLFNDIVSFTAFEGENKENE